MACFQLMKTDKSLKPSSNCLLGARLAFLTYPKCLQGVSERKEKKIKKFCPPNIFLLDFFLFSRSQPRIFEHQSLNMHFNSHLFWPACSSCVTCNNVSTAKCCSTVPHSHNTATDPIFRGDRQVLQRSCTARGCPKSLFVSHAGFD